jgi:hypothetical protein
VTCLDAFRSMIRSGGEGASQRGEIGAGGDGTAAGNGDVGIADANNGVVSHG